MAMFEGDEAAHLARLWAVGVERGLRQGAAAEPATVVSWYDLTDLKENHG